MFASIFTTLYCAHAVGDHWIQTQWQADHKAQPNWTGRLACVKHVATYTITAMLFLGIVMWRMEMEISTSALMVGLLISSVSHYVADRRILLRRLAIRLGKDQIWLDGNGGMYALDQAWHIGWLMVAALAMS